jgi:hypothetical protein
VGGDHYHLAKKNYLEGGGEGEGEEEEEEEEFF